MAAKVGIVGYGYAGRVFHAPLIAQVKGLELYAIASRDEGRRRQAQKDWGISVYSSPEDLFSDPKVDLVVIATPHNTHHPLTKSALQAGKHVVVDKPFTLTVDEADDLIAESQKQNRLLSVFHNRRWDWDFLTVKGAIENNLIGEVWLMELNVGRYNPTGRWRAERESMGSLLHDWGVHLIDQALLLMGKPKKVLAWRNFRVWQLSVESFIRTVFDYGDGRIVTIEVNNIRRVERPRWYVLGDKGGLIKFGLDPQEDALRQGDITKAHEAPEQKAKVWTELDGYNVEITLESVHGDWREYYRNIAKVLNEGEELAVKPEEAREVIRMVEASLKSAETGEPIKVD
ncbi:MAG: Gfo/Idh/MocA family oxidoreductase [Armatimonadetes bacterium]|nr:Gfo/Idh/MocA family oxidoreductase [Armatimonadota bacterium]MDW8028713.1 Gfo/Idh/MocA family oxidoreductase [Armatimonadota bacterium]